MVKEKLISTEVTFSDLLLLQDRLNEFIRNWIMNDHHFNCNGKLDKFMGLLNTSNVKLINDKERNKFVKASIINAELDEQNAKEINLKIFSRISDLYVQICMIFPNDFISIMKQRHKNGLEQLGYTCDDPDLAEIGWLLFYIAYQLKYTDVNKVMN